MEKYAADEKLEQMNAQKRRMRQLEHRKAVDKLIEDKRQQREREANEEIVWDKHQAELEAFRLHVVEQERQRLLREQAAKLVGYLPKVRMDYQCHTRRSHYISPPKGSHSR